MRIRLRQRRSPDRPLGDGSPEDQLFAESCGPNRKPLCLDAEGVPMLTKKLWRKPEVKSIEAGSAEGGGTPRTDSKSGGNAAKS
jgi:hypothetical protein